MGVDPKKLEYGPGAIYAGFASSPGPGVGTFWLLLRWILDFAEGFAGQTQRDMTYYAALEACRSSKPRAQ